MRFQSRHFAVVVALTFDGVMTLVGSVALVTEPRPLGSGPGINGTCVTFEGPVVDFPLVDFIDAAKPLPRSHPGN